MERLKGLDGIRGGLAILVALSHAFGHFTGWGSAFFPFNATFAVDIFFVLSGIVLYHSHLQEIKSKAMSFKAFVVKRFLRLYPMHIFGILMVPIALMISIGQPYPEWIGDVTAKNLFGDALMMNAINVGFNLSSNQPSWSISIEFYIGTLVAFFCCRNKLLALFLPFLTIAAFYTATINTHNLDQMNIFLFNGGIVRCIYCMSIGILSYSLIMRFRSYLSDRSSFPKIFSLLGFILMCGMVIHVRIPMYIYFALIAIVSVAIAMIACIGFRFLSFLDSRFFVMLGKRSFSIYLMHTPLIYLFIKLKVENNYLNSLLAVGVIVLSVIVAGFTFKYIEKPPLRILSSPRINTGETVK